MVINKTNLTNSILIPYRHVKNIISLLPLKHLQFESKRSNLREMLITILINTRNNISKHGCHLKLEKTSFPDKKKIFLAIINIPKEKRKFILTKIGTIISDTSTVSDKIRLIEIFKNISLEKVQCIARQINSLVTNSEEVNSEATVNLVQFLSSVPVEKLSLIEKKQDYFISDTMSFKEKDTLIRSLQFLNINHLELILNQLGKLISSNMSTEDKQELINLFLINYKKNLMCADQAIRLISETMRAEDRILILNKLGDICLSNLDISDLEFLVTQTLRLISETMSAQERISILDKCKSMDRSNLEFLVTRSLRLISETMSAQERISILDKLLFFEESLPQKTSSNDLKESSTSIVKVSKKKKRKNKNQKLNDISNVLISSNSFSLSTDSDFLQESPPRMTSSINLHQETNIPISETSRNKKRKKKNQKSNDISNTPLSNHNSFFSITTLKNIPIVTPYAKLTVLYKSRIERWFASPNEAVRDPRYKDYNTSRVKDKQCIAYHSFPKIIDGLLETNYSLKSNSSDNNKKDSIVKYGILGSIFFPEQNQEHYGVFEYTINSNGECYHRCFSQSSKEFSKKANYKINSIKLKNKKTSINYIIGKTEVKLDDNNSIIIDDKANNTVVKLFHPSNFLME